MDVIQSYCQEVFRVLRPGSVFKFQVNGIPISAEDFEPDTWLGVTLSERGVAELARSTGFLLEASEGAGSQYFWVRFRKPWD